MGLELVELIYAIEEEFKIEIPNEVAETLTTPKTIIDFVYSQFTWKYTREQVAEKFGKSLFLKLQLTKRSLMKTRVLLKIWDLTDIYERKTIYRKIRHRHRRNTRNRESDCVGIGETRLQRGI